MVVKVFFLLQSHFAALGIMFTKFIGFLSDMKDILVFAKKSCAGNELPFKP
jgi:hypothetical protein